MKRVRLFMLHVFVSVFGPDRAQRSIAFQTYHFQLTDQYRNSALIYSVTICELTKKKGLCTVREWFRLSKAVSSTYGIWHSLSRQLGIR